MLEGITGAVVTTAIALSADAARTAIVAQNLANQMNASQAAQQHKQTAEQLAAKAQAVNAEASAFLATLLA